MSEPKLPLRLTAKIPVYLHLKVGTVLKSASGHYVPRKLNHLWFAGPNPTGPNLTYPSHPDFEAENGHKQVTHGIQFLSDEPAVNLETGYVLFGREGLDRGVVLCRGNGSECECRGTITPEGQIQADGAEPFKPLAGHPCGEGCPLFKAGACKLFGVLRFRTPGRTPIGKVDQIRTTSINSIRELMGSMEAIKGETAGVLSGIPLRIRIEHRKGDGGQSDFQVFSVEAEAKTPGDLLEQAAQARAHRLKVEAMRREAGVTDPTLEDRLRETRSIGYETGTEALAIQQEFAPNPAEVSDSLLDDGVAVRPEKAVDPLAQMAAAVVMQEDLDPRPKVVVARPVGPLSPAGSADDDRTATYFHRDWLRSLGYEDFMNPGLRLTEAKALIDRLEAEKRERAGNK